MKCQVLLKGLGLIACLFMMLTSNVMAQDDFCVADFDYSGGVDAGDVDSFLAEWNHRTIYSNPCPPDGPAPVPKTGQTYLYTVGDDGDLEKGVAWPNPRFKIIYYDANYELCTNQTADCDDDPLTDLVQDNLTGLIWTRNANSFANKYSWVDTFFGVGMANATDAWGYNDWRVPNVRELLSLIDYSATHPALPSGHPFMDVQINFDPVYYWTSTTHPFSTNTAYCVDFGWNTLNQTAKNTDTNYVWPVRGGR